jgi:hypothetical protein
VECEKSSSVEVLDTGAFYTKYHTRSKALKWHTYTIHVSIVSRLKNHSLTCLLPPFIYAD